MLSFLRRTLGRRSMRKHAEKERLREAQRAATHIPAAGDSKSIITCRVSLLDGTDVSVDLPKKAKGQELFDQIMYHLDLIESDYFGLRFMDSAQVAHWLDGTKSIKKQVKIGSPYCLHLRVKFYSSEPNNLREELTRLECPFDTAVQLAAYNLQAELGDYDLAEHSPELVSEFRFVPTQTEEMELAIFEKWKEYSGKTEYQTTKTSKARRSTSFERRPSKRYSRRTLHMKASIAKPEELSVHNNVSTQINDSQQTWSLTSVSVIPSTSSGPVLVEIENLPQNSGTDKHDRKCLSLSIDLLDSPDLLETAIGDVIRSSDTMETSPALDDINIATRQTGLEEPEVECGTLKDASEKLKQLEMENSPLLSPRSNIDVNVNSQEEVVKLTEKCLNNTIESPGLNAMRVPPDFKSNILKAQVEAVHKVTRGNSLLSHKNTSVQDATIDSAVVNENVFLSKDSLAPMHTIPADSSSVLKDATDELDALLLSLTENLIDHTVAPQQSGAISNGLGRCGTSLAGKEGHGNKDEISLISPPAPFLVDAVTR
ncbi:Band 4.1-like protein 5 [Sciurus carolinensis]|uniref:Band 4.1-like protein 5 n=1 Tax=Sciurus carolinensis TaxID=30640 RepID=A0AA41T6S2_SCICA|nr:Band 4.1-like protein 5 [Sciurus carolinensis]